jgi:O-acetyl-ADP-ribose deacetylase (regulator of RNase III)
MTEINYVTGDATAPQGDGVKIICHICNDIGAWGAGFVLAVSNKWRYPEDFYRARHTYPLGHVDILSVEDNLFVANMIAQHGIRPDADGVPPIRYAALVEALVKVNIVAEELNATLHMPRIGAGLAGGDWKAIEKIVQTVVKVPVTVYDLPK